MSAIGVTIALLQYVAILTAIGALARLSGLMALRALDLWQDGVVEPDVGPEQEIG